MKKFLFPLLSSLLLLCMTFSTGCGNTAPKNTASPEAALKELQQAVQERDMPKVATYVDLDSFLAHTYDQSANETALAIEVLHERYPEDPFFWHDTAFMQQYARKHRDISLHFIRSILDYYFSKEVPVATYDENPTSWLSGELAKLHDASTAELTEIRRPDDRHATLVLLLKGDNSPYGALTDGITLELGLELQTDGKWKFTEIQNIPALILPVADKAEMFWTFHGWQ